MARKLTSKLNSSLKKHLMPLGFVAILTFTVFTASYLNSKKLDIFPSSAYGPTPTPAVCTVKTPGATRCQGNAVQSCINGQWQTVANCSLGCNPYTLSCSTPVPPPTPPCFLAGTKVATAHGSKNIEELTVNDKVLSFDATEKVNNSLVSNIYKATKDHYYKITSGSTQVSVTGEHPFYIGDGKFTEAQNLQSGDMIYLLSNNRVEPSKVDNIKRVDDQVDVYNLSVDKDNTYFANTFAVHNKLSGPANSEANALLLNQCYADITSTYGLYLENSGGAYISYNSIGGVGNCGQNSQSVPVSRVSVNYQGLQYNGRCCITYSGYNNAVSRNCGSGTVYAHFGNLSTSPLSEDVTYSCRLSHENQEGIRCITNGNYSAIIQRLQQRVANAAGSMYPFLRAEPPTGDAAICKQMTGRILGWPTYTDGYCCPSADN